MKCNVIFIWKSHLHVYVCVLKLVCMCAHLSQGCSRNSFIPITMWVRIRWWWLVWRRLPWKSLSPFSKDYPRWRRTLDNACGGTEGLAVSLIRNMEGGRWAICRKKWTHFSPGPRTGTLLSGCRDFKAKSCAGRVSALFGLLGEPFTDKTCWKLGPTFLCVLCAEYISASEWT